MIDIKERLRNIDDPVRRIKLSIRAIENGTLSDDDFVSEVAELLMIHPMHGAVKPQMGSVIEFTEKYGSADLVRHVEERAIQIENTSWFANKIGRHDLAVEIDEMKRDYQTAALSAHLANDFREQRFIDLAIKNRKACVLSIMADTYAKQGAVDGARKLFRKSIMEDMRRERGRFSAATIVHNIETLATNPEVPEYRRKLLENPERARHLCAAIAKFAGIHGKAGELYEKLGEDEKAIVEYEKSLMNPEKWAFDSTVERGLAVAEKVGNAQAGYEIVKAYVKARESGNSRYQPSFEWYKEAALRARDVGEPQWKIFEFYEKAEGSLGIDWDQHEAMTLELYGIDGMVDLYVRHENFNEAALLAARNGLLDRATELASQAYIMLERDGMAEEALELATLINDGEKVEFYAALVPKKAA